MGAIGQDIALQNMNIFTGDQPLEIGHDVNVAGNISISAGSLDIDSKLTSTGGDINANTLNDINMSATSQINTSDGSINLTSGLGNINISSLNALSQVNVNSTIGNITNSISDYLSDDDTSINITSPIIALSAGNNIGLSVDQPIVVKAGTGTIDLSAGSKIYIANLDNSTTNSNNDILDNTTLSVNANTDAIHQLKKQSFNDTSFAMIDISDPAWINEESNEIQEYSFSSPRIYYSKKGWRLGNPN